MKYLSIFFLLVFSAAVSASDHQCQGSCTITVCDGTTCVVYRCDTTGCSVVAEYDDVQEKSGSATIASFAADSTRLDIGSCAGQRCAAKVCDAGICTVYAFDRGKVNSVATIEDTQEILDAVISEYLREGAGQR